MVIFEDVPNHRVYDVFPSTMYGAVETLCITGLLIDQD